MRIACWITKATYTHSEYVIRIICSQKNGYANALHYYAYTHIPYPANLFNILGIMRNNLFETKVRFTLSKFKTFVIQ